MKTRRSRITALVFLILFVTLMLLPTQSITKTDLTHALEGPSAAHWLGTDNIGRDLFSLLVNGCFRTLLVVAVATGTAIVTGVLLGLVSGWFGGIPGLVIQFLTDFSLIVPSFIAALVFTALFGFSLPGIGAVLGLTGFGEYANQVTALTKRLKGEEYILNERALGIRTSGILVRHILPNIADAVLTFLANSAGSVVLSYAGLAFIGLGTDAASPDWGTMIYQYRIYLTEEPQLVLWPTLGILLLSLFFHLMFDNTSGRSRG